MDGQVEIEAWVREQHLVGKRGVSKEVSFFFCLPYFEAPTSDGPCYQHVEVCIESKSLISLSSTSTNVYSAMFSLNVGDE